MVYRPRMHSSVSRWRVRFLRLYLRCLRHDEFLQVEFEIANYFKLYLVVYCSGQREFGFWSGRHGRDRRQWRTRWSRKWRSYTIGRGHQRRRRQGRIHEHLQSAWKQTGRTRLYDYRFASAIDDPVDRTRYYNERTWPQPGTQFVQVAHDTQEQADLRATKKTLTGWILTQMTAKAGICR